MPRKKNWKIVENQKMRKNWKIKLLSEVKWSRVENHITEGIFCMLLRQDQKQEKKPEVQLFLARLLVPLALASQPRFCLVLEILALDLTIGLAIARTKSMGGGVAVGFSGWSWWKVLISCKGVALLK